MNTLQLSKIVFAAVLLCAATTSFAQRPGSGNTWKKEVFRLINISEKEDNKEHHLKDASVDTTLLEMILSAVRSGKVTAYSNYDHSFTTKLTVAQLNSMLTPGPDTMMIVDPISGKEQMRIVNHEFDYSVVTKYRYLEEWSFNPSTGKTDIQITGIAPIKEIFVDGNFRGVQAIFWLKYKDVSAIIGHYDQAHPGHSMSLRLWNDYFVSDVKPEGAK